MLIGASVVLYFGSAKQYFNLRFPKGSHPYFLLFLFLIWIVPLPVGPLVGLSGLGDTFAQPILSISPVIGIGMGDSMAVASSVLLAVAFGLLRLGVEKKARTATVRSR